MVFCYLGNGCFAGVLRVRGMVLYQKVQSWSRSNNFSAIIKNYLSLSQMYAMLLNSRPVKMPATITKRGIAMLEKRISYNKLWKLLIDKKMTKTEMKDAAGISTTSVAKLGKGENVTTGVLLKICTVLNCDVTDIMEIEQEKKEF
jgi:DNA-binding Xre family transcriptional regulator